MIIVGLEIFGISSLAFLGSSGGLGELYLGSSNAFWLIACENKVKIGFSHELSELMGFLLDLIRADGCPFCFVEVSHNFVHSLFIFSRTFLKEGRVFLDMVHHAVAEERSLDLVAGILESALILSSLLLLLVLSVDVPVGVTLLVEINKLLKFGNLSFEGGLTVEHSLLVSIGGLLALLLLHGLLEGDDLVHFLVFVAEFSTDLSEEGVVLVDDRLGGWLSFRLFVLLGCS